MPWFSRPALLTVPLLISTGIGSTNVPVPAHVQPAPIDRLAALADVYGTVRYFHPALAKDGTGWDAAVANAVPRVLAAADARTAARELQQMFLDLGDPATRITRSAERNELTSGVMLRVQSRANGIVVLTLASGAATPQAQASVAREVAGAKAVVIELRSDAPLAPEAISNAFVASGLERSLTATRIAGVAQRLRTYSGYPPEQGTTSGGYTSPWKQIEGPAIEPVNGVAEKRVVFVIGAGVPVPAVAAALQQARRGAILVEGTPNAAAIVRTRRVALGDGIESALRLGDVVYADGTIGLRADSVLAVAKTAAERDRARATAVLWTNREIAPVIALKSSVPDTARPVAFWTSPGASVAYPNVGWRVVSAYRVWNTFRYFFPYKHLMKDDWDGVLRTYLPRFVEARDSLQYILTVSEMLTHTRDSHVNTSNRTSFAYFGPMMLPMRVRIIEGQPVVTDILNDSVARAAGIAIGDVIVTIDGESAAARSERISRYTTTSTPQWLERTVANRFLNGPAGEATLQVRGSNGVTREVKLPRGQWPRGRERNDPMIRILPGNIGYADLDRLPRDSVNVMFERLKDTDGIVFDMRGYPQGTAWSIAPRLTSLTGVEAAEFRRNMVASPEIAEITSFNFKQPIPPTELWRYTKPTVMLIDERAISQAEHTGLFLKTANNTVFVGSPTAGANGDVTFFQIAGGASVTFTGHDVRWADGKQLQQVGLQPDIPIKPTIAGIRAGRDEVLERGIEAIRSMARPRSNNP